MNNWDSIWFNNRKVGGWLEINGFWTMKNCCWAGELTKLGFHPIQFHYMNGVQWANPSVNGRLSDYIHNKSECSQTCFYKDQEWRLKGKTKHGWIPAIWGASAWPWTPRWGSCRLTNDRMSWGSQQSTVRKTLPGNQFYGDQIFFLYI